MDLEFSIMAPSAASIQPLMDQFAAETGIHVHLRQLVWDSAWSMFVRSALYGDGPDVSEVGTTWIGDLIGMNALRPFAAVEIASLGRAPTFLPISWKTAIGLGERVWSIPWLSGARMIFYRPALLERAGFDPGLLAAGGLDHRQFLELVERLHAAGVPVPWTTPTGYTHTTLHNIASWVWAAGGDFIRADGRKTLFTQPEALEGMEAYFALGRTLSPAVRGLNGLEPDEFFLNSPEVAMTLSGPWVFAEARRQEGIAVALPPGASFVGGSNLVVWKHSQNPEGAVRLVRFLTQHAAQVCSAQTVGLLPARAETLETPPFSTDPWWMTAVRAIRTGRTYPSIRLWGLVEDRMTAGLWAVWTDVLAGEAPRAVLARHLVPLAERLDKLLEKE